MVISKPADGTGSVAPDRQLRGRAVGTPTPSTWPPAHLPGNLHPSRLPPPLSPPALPSQSLSLRLETPAPRAAWDLCFLLRSSRTGTSPTPVQPLDGEIRLSVWPGVTHAGAGSSFWGRMFPQLLEEDPANTQQPWPACQMGMEMGTCDPVAPYPEDSCLVWLGRSPCVTGANGARSGSL